MQEHTVFHRVFDVYVSKPDATQQKLLINRVRVDAKQQFTYAKHCVIMITNVSRRAGVPQKRISVFQLILIVMTQLILILSSAAKHAILYLSTL